MNPFQLFFGVAFCVQIAALISVAALPPILAPCNEIAEEAQSDTEDSDYRGSVRISLAPHE